MGEAVENPDESVCQVREVPASWGPGLPLLPLQTLSGALERIHTKLPLPMEHRAHLGASGFKRFLTHKQHFLPKYLKNLVFLGEKSVL